MSELHLLAKNILKTLQEDDYKYHYKHDMYIAKNKAYELGGQNEDRSNE